MRSARHPARATWPSREQGGPSLFFSFRFRNTFASRLTCPSASLLELTEVYHAPLVAASACASQLNQHVQTEAPTVFALAAIHNNNFVAQFALAQFGNAFSRTLVSPDEWTISGRPRSLAEIPADLFGRIPPLALRNALCLQDRALLPSDQEAEGLSNPWPELASAFSVRAYPSVGGLRGEFHLFVAQIS
jgi:hypothetical protein